MQVSEGGDVRMLGLVLSGGGRGPAGKAGGVYMSGGSVSLVECLVTDNVCDGGGGAFFMKGGATLSMVGCWAPHGALPRRAPSPRCTAESMHRVWHRSVASANPTYRTRYFDDASARAFVTARPRTWPTATPCTSHSVHAADPVHRVW